LINERQHYQVVKKQVDKSQTIYNTQKQKHFPDKRQDLEIIKQIFEHRTIRIDQARPGHCGISFCDLFAFWSSRIVIFHET
jgi:hypothetical protein